MKVESIKKGLRVIDRWYREWGTGVVIKVLKTRIHVRFFDEVRVYDLPHRQFLEKVR